MNKLQYLSAELGPGKYFIGDICYALEKDIYRQIWGDKFQYQDGCYEDFGFAVAGTMYGDGCYNGTDGVSYSVDAGVLGITNISKQQRYDNAELNRLGKIVDVKESICMERLENGEFIFIVDGKSFIISTSLEYEEGKKIKLK